MKPDRRRLRAARAAFVSGLAGPVRAGLERALAARVLPHLGPPAILGTHAAIGDEIDPAALEAAAVAAGWRLAFPRVEGDAPLAFHLASRADLRPGFRGIPEPPTDAPRIRPTVLLVPMLAADRAGNRIGQGGGLYDRTLAHVRAAGPITAIGLAWDMQLVEPLAPDPWDQPLDAIATPTVFHRAAPAATPPA
ncbi:MAG: 5-formyltetrahydrofolate cyclo-ligase [Sphingomonadaceae bacterium]